MILITGANGMTGHAIIEALLSKGEEVRGLVNRVEQIDELKALGTTEVVVGDMLDQNRMNEVFNGAHAVYHICSAINPNEVEIGQIAINAARFAKVKHFVYHSVLHSVIQEMPHHQKKLIVEEKVVNSGIPYTIIQPAIYMQILNESIKSIAKDGIFHQNFFTTKETHICMVDLNDVAEVASIVLTEPDYKWATYEISGPENLSLADMIANLKKYFGNEIKVDTPSEKQKTEQFKKYKLGDYKTDTLLKMFKFYNECGFNSNSSVSKLILGRKPNDFSSFIYEQYKKIKS